MVNVVYLLGAGITEAERTYSSWDSGFLTHHITDAIIKKINNEKNRVLKAIINELMVQTDDTYEEDDNQRGGIDIEYYITLFESMDQEEYKEASDKLKEYFFDYFKENLFKDDDRLKPYLTQVLLDIHRIPRNEEKIKAILTLNYDDLTDLAFRKVWCFVNYVIKTSENSSNDDIPPLLKIHGSFNWRNSFPIEVMDNSIDLSHKESIWIPPGVFKKKDRYPYNILWGRAKELLNCDILRIIGCSLNQNDWGLLELLFHTQRLFRYKIEIIDKNKVGQKIKSSYAFLKNSQTIFELAGLLELKRINNEVITDKDDLKSYWGDESNIFESWLRMKIELLEANNIDLPTDNNFVREFMGYS